MFGMTSGADWLIAGLGNPEPKYDTAAPYLTGSAT